MAQHHAVPLQRHATLTVEVALSLSFERLYFITY